MKLKFSDQYHVILGQTIHDGEIIRTNVTMEVRKMEKAKVEYDASFELYDNAVRRGTVKWQQVPDHPSNIWPDVAKLVDWMATRMDKLEAVVPVLQVLLDQVDYTAGACSLTEMVGAVLPKQVIENARNALADLEEK